MIQTIFGVRVQAIAGPGFVERMHANPRYYETPEHRLLLSFEWKESLFMPANMGLVILGDPTLPKFSLPDLKEAASKPPLMFVFDERTDEEKAAAPVPGNREDLNRECRIACDPNDSSEA